MIELRNIRIGTGAPKICVPLVGDSLDALLREAKLAETSGADIVEWRADYFDSALDSEKLAAAFSALKKALSKPILFTVRTVTEGGKLDITKERYFDLLDEVIQNEKPELIDIELSCGEESCRKLIAKAKSACVKTVLSSHDFAFTPSDKDMLATLHKAVVYGGDIAKLAVMPHTSADVLRLLCVLERFSGLHPDIPVIAIAMGNDGIASRVCGGFFGSAVTFAALEQASAPGQISCHDMKKILDLLYTHTSNT